MPQHIQDLEMGFDYGLVLSGGGARGAYQVGVIRALATLLEEWKIDHPFSIYSGVSAGAISSSYLAAQCDDFTRASKGLVDLWSGLTSDQIFRTDALSLGKIGLQWMGELSFGSLSANPGTTRALLDTTPLKKLIEDHMDFSKLARNFEHRHLKALAVTALDYKDSTAVTFVQTQADTPDWQKSRKVSEKTPIRSEHIMASSAIPLLFPPVQVDGRYFGDGCVRNTHPCSPSIYLGARKLVIIGVRSQNLTAYDHHVMQNKRPPSTGRVLNVLLNSILLDGVDLDVERMKKVNEMVNWIPKEKKSTVPYKSVDFVWICPSQDIGLVAARKSKYLPKLIRFLLKNLGTIEEASEIVSYLLFEKEFTTELIEMGFEDGMNTKQQIKELFEA